MNVLFGNPFFFLFFNVFSVALLVIIDFDSAADTLLAKRDETWY